MEGSWIGRRFGLFQDLWPRKTPQKQTPSALCQSWSLFFLESFFSFLGIGSYNCKMSKLFQWVGWSSSKIMADINPKKNTTLPTRKTPSALDFFSCPVTRCFYLNSCHEKLVNQPLFTKKNEKRPVLACILHSGILWILKMLQEGNKIGSDDKAIARPRNIYHDDNKIQKWNHANKTSIKCNAIRNDKNSNRQWYQREYKWCIYIIRHVAKGWE